MKFNIPRILFVSLLLLYGCSGFFSDLINHDTAITSFKIEKSKNPSLTQDYEGYIDTYSQRVVVDFKQSSISSSVLKTIIPSITFTSREMYPAEKESVDLNGTVLYELKTLMKSSVWKVSSCCLNTGSGPTLSYVDDWEHTMPTGTVTAAFGDGIIKSDRSTEKLYLFGNMNGGTNDTYMEKINLTTGAVELSNTIPNYSFKSFGDKYLTPAFYLSVTDGSNSYIYQVNTTTLTPTLQATLTSLQSVDVLSLPNSGGTRVKGLTLTAGGDARTFNVFNSALDSTTFDCNTTTETGPIFGNSDYSRETFYMIGLTQNCGALSSGTDIFVSRWDNSFAPVLQWKKVLWSSYNDFLAQIGTKRSHVVTSDGSVIINRLYTNSGTYNAPGKFDLNGNDLTASTNFPNFPAYYWNKNLMLVSLGLYNYNNTTDIFYSTVNIGTGANGIERSDANGNIRTMTFTPSFSVGCNTSTQIVTVSVDSGYNLYYSCLKLNSVTGRKEVYVKKFKATVIQ